MPKLTRRQSLVGMLTALGGAGLAWFRRTGVAPAAAQTGSKLFLPLLARGAAQARPLYVVRNGTPVTNVQRVIAEAGGIERFVDHDDVVVIKPNGQWPNQGYTHTQCIKALIDVILARPGGFGGEIILTEHVHRSPSETLADSYCWNMSVGNRQRNWPDMNYLELIADYHSRGILKVTAAPMTDSDSSGDWTSATGPTNVSAGKHAWVRLPAYRTASGNSYTPSYAILRSSYSGHLIDFKNGVWANGAYTGAQVRLMFMPTLNNHGSLNGEDYAGPTSAVKTHIGFIEGTSLHSVGYGNGHPESVGEAVGHLITQVVRPTFYLTCAEWTGYGGRTGSSATQTKTVGLCADPVTLDYWMCKHVMLPCRTSQTFMNADLDNNFRKTLLGCQSKGVGTLDESEIDVHEVTLA